MAQTAFVARYYDVLWRKGDTMNARLSQGEKLKDLRTANRLKLADVESETGISTSTLQRLEADAANKAKAIVLCKNLGMNTSKAGTDEGAEHCPADETGQEAEATENYT